MAEKQVVAATLSVETGNSNNNIKEVNKNLNEVKSSLSATGATATKTGKDIDVSTGSFGKLKEQMTALPGPLGQAGEGVNKLSGTFKALLANPVILVLTALVAVLALVYKAFTNTFEGGQKMEQVFAGIKAAGQALIDNLENIGGAIVKVFKFDFSGAIKQIRGVAVEAGVAFTAMSKLTKESQKLEKEQAQNDVEQAQRASRLAKLREDAYDDSVPIANRKKLLSELKTEQDKDAAGDIERAEKVAANRIAKASLEKDGIDKNYKEIAEATIALERVKTDAANEGRRIAKSMSAAEKQEAAERKAIEKEETDRKKEAAQQAKEYAREQKKLLDERIKQEKAAAKARAEGLAEELAGQIAYGEQLAKDQAKLDLAEINRVKENEKTRLSNKKKLAELDFLDNPTDPAKKIKLVKANLDIENSMLADNDIQRQVNAKKASDEIVKIKTDEVEAKRQIAEIEADNERQKVSAIADALGTLSEIAGKQTAAGKALAIAQTVINTYQAGFAAFKGMVTTIPGPVGIALGVVAAAGALASGFAAVKKIVAVQVPGGGGGGGSVGSIPLPAAPIAPQASTTRLDQTSLNQVGNATVRAYVLDSDATNNRERNERLNRAARLA